MYIKNGSFKKYKYIISYVQPKIYQQPSDGYVQIGDNFKFSLKVRGSLPITYQWYKDDFPLFGQTTNELLLTNIQESNNGVYYCEIRNNKNTIESKNVKLNIVQIPYITLQPSNFYQEFESDAVFSVSAIGTEPLSYQWYKNNLIIAGATAKNLYINSIKTADLGSYQAVISNQFGEVSSYSAILYAY